MHDSEIILFTFSVAVSLIVLRLGFTIYVSTHRYETEEYTNYLRSYLNRTCIEMSKNSKSMIILSKPYCTQQNCSFIIILSKNNSTTSCSVRI